MNTPDILTALRTALQNSENLTAVADVNILIGKRTNINEYPVIEIVPGAERKVSDTYPTETWKLPIKIYAGIKVFDEEKYMVGDSDVPGITDFDLNIRKALSEDHTLGGKCVNLSILGSDPTYDGDYPVVGTVIDIEVLYEQNRLTRA